MIGTLKKNRRSVFREIGLEVDDGDTMGPPVAEHVSASEGEVEHSQNRLAPLDTRSVGRGVTTDAGYEDGEASNDGKTEACATTHTEIRQVPQIGSPSSESSSPSSPTSPESPSNKTPWYAKLAAGKRPRVRTGSNAPPSALKPLSTVTMLALAVAVMAPLAGRMNRETVGVADAGVVLHRADSPTDVCARWAQQSTLQNISMI